MMTNMAIQQPSDRKCRKSNNRKNVSRLCYWQRCIIAVAVLLVLCNIYRGNTVERFLAEETNIHEGRVGGGGGGVLSRLSQSDHERTAQFLSGTMDPGLHVSRRQPTHEACQDVEGIYHVLRGDLEGGVGTALFQLVLVQLLYAEKNNLKPWIHFNNESNVIYDPLVHGGGGGLSGDPLVVKLRAMVGRNATYQRRHPEAHRRDVFPGPPDASQPVHSQELTFSGTGIWEHYLEPVSDFAPGDISCESKLYVTMDPYLINPGLHGYADDAIRSWRYTYLPEYLSKPYLPLSEWLEPQRRRAHALVTKYIRFRPYLQKAAAAVNPACSEQDPCLGLHIRHSDKAHGRRVLATSEFLPYAEAFVQQGGKYIYVATDSTEVLDEIRATWPPHVRSNIRTSTMMVRSSNTTAVFDMASHHRTNQEAFVEILALSQCQYMIHGLSAVSESAIWINLALHERSVNLEDDDHLSVEQFTTVLQKVQQGHPASELPRPGAVREWWSEIHGGSHSRTEAVVYNPVATNGACEGYAGVLLISSIGHREVTIGGAFFTAVLNQLIYAERYNLKPWIHLNNQSATYLYDPVVHGQARPNTFQMIHGMDVTVYRQDEETHVFVPSKPQQREELSFHEYQAQGNGIWQTYLEPVSDFVPGDDSCRNKPLIQMEDRLVSPGMDLYCPWCVRAWRNDDIPSSVWPSTPVKPLAAFMEPMRHKASEMVSKYYRFRPYIVRRAGEVNPVTERQQDLCLGVHLRSGAKGGGGQGRRQLKAHLFLPYIEAYVKAGGKCIYVASDSHRAISFVKKSLPANVTDFIRSQGDAVIRSSDAWSLDEEEHHRVNSEVLVEILALSRCGLLLHAFSTVPEAAIYLNPKLRNASVNLEDRDSKLSVDEFEALSKKILTG